MLTPNQARSILLGLSAIAFVWCVFTCAKAWWIHFESGWVGSQGTGGTLKFLEEEFKGAIELIACISLFTAATIT